MLKFRWEISLDFKLYAAMVNKMLNLNTYLHLKETRNKRSKNYDEIDCHMFGCKINKLVFT